MVHMMVHTDPFIVYAEACLTILKTSREIETIRELFGVPLYAYEKQLLLWWLVLNINQHGSELQYGEKNPWIW